MFASDNQLYAAAGYVVVYANPRGSTSYGEAFANEIDRNYPSHDYDDLMSVVDAAIAKGFVEAMGGRIAAASPIHDRPDGSKGGTRILISLRKDVAGAESKSSQP